jgi:hypothetical protein
VLFALQTGCPKTTDTKVGFLLTLWRRGWLVVSVALCVFYLRGSFLFFLSAKRYLMHGFLAADWAASPWCV